MDPLSELIVDANEVDRALLKECIHGFVGIDGESGEPVLLPGFNALSGARTKILAYLLGRKASRLLDKTETEAVGPTGIAEATGIAMGTVGRVMRELLDDRLVLQNKGRGYFVPSHQLAGLSALMADERRQNGDQ